MKSRNFYIFGSKVARGGHDVEIWICFPLLSMEGFCDTNDLGKSDRTVKCDWPLTGKLIPRFFIEILRIEF